MCEFEFVGGMHTARIKPHMCIYSDAEEERQVLTIEAMDRNIDIQYVVNRLQVRGGLTPPPPPPPRTMIEKC